MLLPTLLLVPVALEHRVAPVEAVVREIAQKSGRKLGVGREMANEVLYVALKPHEPDELLALVAKAASAEWIDDGGLTLMRTASLRRKQEIADRTALGAGFAAAVKPWIDEDEAPWTPGVNRAAKLVDMSQALTNPATPAQGLAQRARLAGLTPLGRALCRLLRAMPPETWTDVPRGESARFALRPNRRQRPLPAAVGMAQYARERGLFAADAERLPQDRRSALRQWAPSVEEPPFGALAPLLVASRYAGGMVGLRLMVIDGKGRTLDETETFLDPSTPEGAKELPGYVRWSPQPVALSAAAASFVAGLTGKKVDPQEAAKLRDPVANEPLAALMTDPMDAMTKAMDAEEAIVALPDDAARDAGDQLEQNPKLGEFADGLAKDVASDVRDGRWVGWARFPSEAARAKVDRATLRNFMQTGFAPVPSLNDVARYALAQSAGAEVSGLEERVLGAAGRSVDPFLLNGLFSVETGGRDLLRAWGGLSPAQRDGLLGGAAIPVASLSPAVRAALDERTFRRTNDLEPLSSQAPRLDATLVADGLAPEATLSLDGAKTELLAVYGSVRGLETMDMSGLGYVLENQERENSLGEESGYPPIAKTLFTPGRRRETTLTLRVTPAYVAKGYLRDTVVDSNAKAMAPNDLPAEHLKEWRRVYDYYRKMRKEG